MTALVCFLIAFGLSWFGTMILLRVPTVRGFVDVPNERSSHEAPKLRVGGIAIVVSFYAAIGYLFTVAPDTRQYIPLAVGSGMLFITGVIDDWRGLGVKVRFLMQFMAAITMVSFGVTLDHFYIPAVGVVELGWIAIPVTVLVFVVSINFYNFIDGIDGLAAGSAFIASGFLALIAFMLGHSGLALIFVAVAGSSVGFLQFNFPPSRLFMGDSGSTFLGFLFAYMAITGNRLSPELPVFIPILILSSLYLDAGLTLFNRIVKRENIFKAHHTHYYQRLLSLGLNHKQVTLLEYALMVLLGIGAVVYFKAGRFFPVFLSACWIVLFTLAILKIRGLERGDKKLFWEKRTVFAIGLDLLLIAISYLGAYFLRMNFRLTEPEWTAVVRALPIVLVVRSFVFYRYGLYLSVYKYTSTADIVRILKAVTMGSAVIMTMVVLLYRFVAFPRTLFVLEFFLLTLLLLGSRFSFRLFHEIGKESHGANVRKVGIVGAGDFGERVARELRNNKKNPSSVRCFIDDDPGKIGLTMLGVPIAGPIARLDEIVSLYHLDNVVIAIANLSVGKLSRLGDAAKAAGIPLECKRGPQWPEPGRTDALFDPLALGLGGESLQKVDLPARVFYRGKRVLLTGGGGPIGGAMARELIALGASVIVQIDTAAESKRFDPSLEKRYLYIRGSLTARGTGAGCSKPQLRMSFFIACRWTWTRIRTRKITCGTGQSRPMRTCRRPLRTVLYHRLFSCVSGTAKSPVIRPHGSVPYRKLCCSTGRRDSRLDRRPRRYGFPGFSHRLISKTRCRTIPGNTRATPADLPCSSPKRSHWRWTVPPPNPAGLCWSARMDAGSVQWKRPRYSHATIPATKTTRWTRLPCFARQG